MKTRSQIGFLTAAIVVGMSPAFAVDEIVVTAQRREEKLQDVPLAVSAFSVESIEARQIDVVKDIGQNVPNLQTYTVTAGAQAMQVHSRGSSVQNPGFNASESPVGIYVDDVYFGRLASANLDLADIERIEVLRGPQGTLYGRNTIAGAIKIISRTPGDEAWLKGSLGVGNYETLKATASAGGPIEDGALAGSVAIVYDDRNKGWFDNPVTGSEPGEYENKIMRGKLHWYGSENFDAVLTVWGADLENDGYNGVPYSGGSDGQPVSGFYDTRVASDAVHYGESDQVGGSLNLSYNFGFATLRSITAISSIDDKFGFDLAGGGGIGLETGNNGLVPNSSSSMNSWSEELQLLGSAFGDRLDWILGAFYLNEDGDQTYAANLTVPTPFGPFSVFSFMEHTQTETDSYAAFAQGTYHLTDRFSFVAGVRYTDDQKKYDNVCTGSTCDGGPVSLDESFDETTFKAGVDFKLTDQALLYLTFAQGFQAGGFQTLCLGDLTTACAGTFYDPQTVDSIEAGLKSDLFDNKLRVNIAAFYAMYDDIQQTAQFDPTPEAPGSGDEGFPLQNVGEVDVYGAELEVTWTPIDALNIYGFVGWQDSDYGTIDPGSTAALASADDLPSNPKLTGKVGFNYTLGLSEMAEFFYGADVYYTDDYYSTVDNGLQIDSYTRLNGFFGIGSPDQRWQLVLTGQNLTDEDDSVSGIFFPGVTNIRTQLPPREYMLTFKFNY